MIMLPIYTFKEGRAVKTVRLSLCRLSSLTSMNMYAIMYI